MSDEMVANYFQLGDPTDSFTPGDDKQRVDLDEYYKTMDQDGATAMVQGTEELSLGKLSKRTAKQLGLPNIHAYDPFPSERNARMGTEGFLGVIAEKFKAFIEMIIKYIRMAINWVVDTVKTFFGFRKTERVTKAINDSLGELKKEFVGIITGFGLDPAAYDPDKVIGDLPAGVDRGPQFVLLRNKFDTDERAIKGLAEALPILQKCVAKTNQSGERVLKTSSVLKKVISEEYNRTRVRKVTSGTIAANESPEVNRVYKACLDMEASLDNKAIADELKALYEALYKVEFNNNELSEGFDKVRKTLQDEVGVFQVNLVKKDNTELMSAISYINNRYAIIQDNELDMRGINWKHLGNAIDKTDADKVKMISDFYQYPNLLAIYQKGCVELRNYTNYCFGVSQALLKVEKQINSLSDWFNRTHAYFIHGVLDDIEKIREINLKARQDGLNPMADIHGNPIGTVFIKEADAQTVLEHFASGARPNIEADLAGVKTAYNNFTNQLGWGVQLK